MQRGDSARIRAKPPNPLVRGLLVVVGTLFVVIGVIGLYVPGLPTTPFLLLGAACYLRSSERLYRWLVEHPRFGAGLRTMLEQRAVPRKLKVASLVIAWAVLGGLALFVVESGWAQALLVGVGAVKTVFMLSIKTLHP